MDFNPFKYCSGLRYLGYLMILMVLAIIALTYWAVIVLVWGPKLIHGGPQAVLAAFIVSLFHVLVSSISTIFAYFYCFIVTIYFILGFF